MKIKTINQVNIAFLEDDLEFHELVGNWLKYSDLIYILQPSTDTRIPTVYEDSDYFNDLRKKANQEIQRAKLIHPNNNTKTCTCCCFVDSSGKIISTTTQDVTAHVFETLDDQVCIREKMKFAGSWTPGDSYEICPGCSYQNHPESRTYITESKNGNLAKYNGSTCLITNHWWCCDDCRRNMFAMGVKKIVIDPKCERIFGDKPVEWYRDN
jgi:deoxycytidylate deaminase